jgi:hypothetical protein
MKNYVLYFLLFLSFKSYSQIKYESGYFITNANEKISCLIKNNDWVKNPKEFKYKTSENSDIQKAELKDIKEFGVLNNFKYKRFTVNIDNSADNVESMSNASIPEFNTEELFLKVLVEGKASLFCFEGKSVTKYFFLSTIQSQNSSFTKNISPQKLLYQKIIRLDNSFTLYLANNLLLYFLKELITMKEI